LTSTLASKPPLLSVTLYIIPNSAGHAFLFSLDKFAVDKPKSSFTLSSPLCATDSEVDFPRNSQRDMRAKPCCGSPAVGRSLGEGPKTYRAQFISNSPATTIRHDGSNLSIHAMP